MRHDATRNWPQLKGLGSLLGLAVIVLFVGVVAMTSSFAHSHSTPGCERDEPALCTEKSELPREWNWKKQDIRFDHMFPKKR